jgi:hypothetical protein
MLAARKLSVRLNRSFALGVTCPVGTMLRIPVRIRSREIDRCVIRITSAAAIIEPVNQEVQLRVDDLWQRIDMEVLAQKVSRSREWIGVSFEVEGTPMQAVGFFLEVLPQPSHPEPRTPA